MKKPQGMALINYGLPQETQGGALPIVRILDPKLISQQRERAPMAADDPSDLETNLWGLNSGGLVINARWRWSDRQIAVIKGLCLQEIKSDREEKTTDNSAPERFSIMTILHNQKQKEQLI